MPRSAWSHLKSRAKRSGGLSLWEDGTVAVVATIIGYLVLDRKSARENAIAALIIGLGAAITWQILRFIWRFFWTVPREVEAERDNALAKLKTKAGLAEEDPRVYLEPLNSDFVSRGYMAFKLSNKGQRVNLAQGIVVQPIQCAPSIKFEYVDRLDMNEEKRLVPTVEGHDIFPSHNILPELRKAWEDAHAGGGFDDAEFPFEITIKYRDAGYRTFETNVSLKYCPLEEDAARRNTLSGQGGETAILKLTNTDIRRL